MPRKRTTAKRKTAKKRTAAKREPKSTIGAEVAKNLANINSRVGTLEMQVYSLNTQRQAMVDRKLRKKGRDSYAPVEGL